MILPPLRVHTDARVFRAPGRVNLIGGQVDYHEGWVVAMAIDREVQVAMITRSDGIISAHSEDRTGEVFHPLPGALPPASPVLSEPAARSAVEHGLPEWGRLVAAVGDELHRAGRPAVGADLHIASSLAIGGGLSSSAAFEVGVALALAAAADWAIASNELAAACQRAELTATGVACGIQDQTASLHGGVFLLDCRSLVIEPLRLPSGVVVVIVDSGVARTLAGSPWTARRDESFAVARDLGLRVLRDATPEQVADRPRGRHAVSEMARVQEFAAALRTGDIERLGDLMLESHASSRDDMGVSIDALDILVECLTAAGAFGARLTGGGFGGCCVALAPAERAAAIGALAAAAYAERTGNAPTVTIASPAPGAGPLPRI